LEINENKYIYQFLPDSELLLKLQNSDKLAFEEIYNRYWKKLSNYALQKTKSIDIAKEITQDLFINIWERKEALKIETLEKYLFSSVKYKVIFELKKQINTTFISTDIDDSSLQYHDNPNAEINELNNIVDQCLDKLPLKTKEIFIKSRREELSHKEISSIFDISEKSVEYHISQALKTLRLGLKDFLIATIVFCNYLFK
jgi:RNA polymerase sigma-70 factor (ECF subfamily)